MWFDPLGRFMGDALMTLFREVADLAPEAREQYYASRKTPPELRAEVESLLRFDPDGADPQGESLTGIVAETESLLQASVSGPGPRSTAFGAYRAIRLLGSGGMGAVFLAERTDGEVERRVAVKVAHAGTSIASFRERFLAERRILASLNHPGIVQLLDAGHSSDGQPYLVMEYVNGVSIDEYCAKLDLREVLRLFLRVCDAVSYAHRNLVIHRDLKPSNILITSAGEAKLLDFGIAAILDTAQNEQTLVRALTPEYASPEQVSGRARTMATDVYSLGAVLYKLLTGETRGSAKPARPVPREIESVVNKALREEPDQRYPTVDALAADIRAYLENRPVSARSGETWYRIHKFLRRNWVTVTAGALVAIALSTGLYVANRERLIAQERFLQVRDLATDIFDFDEKIRTLPGSTQARHELVSLSLRYLERLGTQAGSDQDLALRIAAGYVSVAHVQGVPGFSNLGDLKAADDSLRKADTWTRSVLAASAKNREALMLSAEIVHDRMIIESMQGNQSESLSFAQASASRLDSFLKLGTPTTAEATSAARIFADIALDNSNLHHGDDAVRYCQRGVELARRSGNRPNLGGLLSLQSNVLRQQGELEEALGSAQEARAILQSLPEDYSRDTNLIIAIWREGRILGQDGEMNLNRPQEAEAALQDAYDLADGLVRRDAADYGARARLVAAARDLADIVRHHDPERALTVYDAALRRSSEIKNAESIRDRIRLLEGSSYPLRALHRSAEAKQRIDAGFQLMEQSKLWPADRVRTGDIVQSAMCALGDHYAETGRASDGAKTYQLLYDKLMASRPLPERDLRDAYNLSLIERRLAELDRQSGRADAASTLDHSRRDLWDGWHTRLPGNAFISRQLSIQ